MATFVKVDMRAVAVLLIGGAVLAAVVVAPDAVTGLVNDILGAIPEGI
ncbi:hypothetical protein [Haloglomus litoreum]|nr:hypothetical protein [Haloglomus sp. DT116]